jgi:hypothetical protein
MRVWRQKKVKTRLIFLIDLGKKYPISQATPLPNPDNSTDLTSALNKGDSRACKIHSAFSANADTSMIKVG